MTENERKELENRAAIVVRGCTQPDSGWYNSPDDLQAVIEGQLAAVWCMAGKAALAKLADTPHGEMTSFGCATARCTTEEVKGFARRLAAKWGAEA